MIILIFMFIGTTFYVLKNGIGKERLLLLYPIAAWLLFSLIFGIVVAVFPSKKEISQIILGLPTTIILIIMCVWIVKKIRANSMARLLAALENGSFKAPEKKIEL